MRKPSYRPATFSRFQRKVRRCSIFIADAHRNDGKRFVVHADEKLTAFLELERAICLRLLTDQILEK
jgi:hypothetical protein